jgi:hypothetical protein
MVARMSNAQSGSLKLIGLRPPADGAAPSGFQSSVPARRIDSCASAPPVPLTRTKFDAPAANDGAADVARMARIATLFMRPDYKPERMKEKSVFA